MKSKLSTLSWLVVAAVGAFVIALVLGLNLFGRLHSADHLLGGLSPAFTAQRVAGDQAAINELSAVVDTLDPLMTRQGGASGEVGKLVGFVSDKTGLPQAAVVKLLQSNFPKTTSLLMALPLSAVSADTQAGRVPVQEPAYGPG